MAAKAKMSGQVCLNHPDVPAATRCETCFKPLCEDCVILENGVQFCSDNCAQNYSQSGERLDDFNSQQRARRRRKRIRRFVTLVVIVVVAVVVWKWLQDNPDKAGELRRKLKGAAQTVKEQVD